MRQIKQSKEDGLFRIALENMRLDRCTTSDINFLRSLTMSRYNRTKRLDSSLRFNSVIVDRNNERDLINRVVAFEFALHTDQQLHSFYSVDLCFVSDTSLEIRRKRSVRLSHKEQRILWDLPPGKIDNISSRLNICIGMLVLIRYNEATELCITNDAEATVFL